MHVFTLNFILIFVLVFIHTTESAAHALLQPADPNMAGNIILEKKEESHGVEQFRRCDHFSNCGIGEGKGRDKYEDKDKYQYEDKVESEDEYGYENQFQDNEDKYECKEETGWEPSIPESFVSSRPLMAGKETKAREIRQAIFSLLPWLLKRISINV
ncbi:hypothetical protein HOY82DRAFT_592518 [Tuber indicum]|nr:hypothetical protein HOY82DRAFT_592518 [Tuber indicum]